MSDKDLQSRLARGERGIPKIPDSPDTRHAQAQPPWCVDGLAWLLFSTAQDVLNGGKFSESPKAYWQEIARRVQDSLASLDGRPAAAGPAEQPAPPQPIEERMKEQFRRQMKEQAGTAEPSAPPQPAEGGLRNTLAMESYDKGYDSLEARQKEAINRRAEQLERAAEPSVEARDMFWPNDGHGREMHLYEIRNGKTKDYVLCHVAAIEEAAKREGMEEAARLVDEKAWTLLDIGDLAASAEMKLMAATLRLPKEQQNG